MCTASVIIPVKNGAAHIAEAIESALQQDGAVAEVIVVDDNSTDSTVSIVQGIADRRVKLLTDRAGRQGVSAARNDGAALACGDGLVFLDADDRLRADGIARLLEELSSGAGAAYGDYQRINENGAPIGGRHLLRGRAKPTGNIASQLLAGNFIVNGGVMVVRRKTFADLGGFDETLRYCEDWHMWCRLALAGQIVYRPIHVMDYRVYPSSVMMRRPLQWADCAPALEAIFSDSRVVAAFPDGIRAKLRERAHAHLNAYIIGQSIRARRFTEAMMALCSTARHRPKHLFKAARMSAAAVAGL